jgi:hypothetical protein
MSHRAALLAICAVAAAACQTPAATPIGSPVLRDVHFAPIVPDAADHAAADLLAAALVADRKGTDRAIAALEDVDAQRRKSGAGPTGLVPLARDLRNAAFLGERAYRRAARVLLERRDVPGTERGRLSRLSASDPLALANARMRDAYLRSTARLFNALVEPVGRSIMTTALAPYRLGESLAAYALAVYRDDALPLQRRQALAHWKEFIARHPDAPEAPEISARIAAAEVRWHRTLCDAALERARGAIGHGRPREALFYAEAALRQEPDEAAAQKLHDRAAHEISVQRDQRAESLRFELAPGAPLLPAGTRRVALALLAPGGDIAAAARDLPERGPVAEAARMALAGERGRAGDDAGMWEALRALARDSEPALARHIRSDLESPVRNPYDAFERARRRDHWNTATWVLLGPAAARPRFSVDGVAEWLLSLPNRVQSVILLPLRVAQMYGQRPPTSARTTAVHARRYLAMHPDGPRADRVRDWLEHYERARENWLGALRVAEQRSGASPDSLEALREHAAQQALDVASREKRRDLRNAMLRNVVRTFPETRAGRDAGERARKELETLTPHHIRITRGFLLENPHVAGPEGLALAPALLDGDPTNGELHPDGVALIGGRQIEFSYLASSGDEGDPPVRKVATLSVEHMARLVSRLEEASFRNALLDSDDALEPNAQRDLVFERARLGLSNDVDMRATAEADYTYRGMRERYGMVRGREALLPFDIVVQGSLSDFSLGAFPRMRPPRETPDAMLYR